jgi:hypothetical protein
MGDERRADQGANTGDRLEGLRRGARPPLGFDLLVDERKMRLKRAEMVGDDPHDRESRLRNIRDVRIVLVKATHEVSEVLDSPFLDNAEFGELAAQRVCDRRALIDQQLPRRVLHQRCLLLFCLDRNEPHVWPRRRLANGARVVGVGLAALDEVTCP